MRLTDRVCRDLARTADAAGRPVRWDDEGQGYAARLNRPGKLSFVIKCAVESTSERSPCPCRPVLLRK